MDALGSSVSAKTGINYLIHDNDHQRFHRQKSSLGDKKL